MSGSIIQIDHLARSFGTVRAVDGLALRDDNEIGPLVSLIVHEGADVEEVRRGKANLEDVFLTLMEEQHS